MTPIRGSRRGWPPKATAVLLAATLSSWPQPSSPAAAPAAPTIANSEATADLTARQWIARGEAQMRGHAAIGVYEMTIITPDWERTLKMRFWEDVDADRAFVRVLSPAREAGSASLKLGDEMWTYLPSVERSMKIPPSMMAQSWMGSDFTNDDLVNGDDVVEQYEHAFTDTTQLDGETVYEITSVPRADAPVVWGRIRAWVRAVDALPVRQDFYDEDDVLVREMELTDIREMDGRRVPTRWVVRPRTEDKEGHVTTLRILEMDFDASIPADTFTRRNLERRR